MEQHPYMQEALGDSYQWRKKRTVAPIRLGGVQTPYSTQCLLVGDAAGHVDPLTGEGIHTAMVAGKVAAQCVYEMHTKHNFSQEACEAYALRVYDAFVYEFEYSSLAAKCIYYMPILLDAMACVGQRRGQKFLDFFGEVMTGVKPKYMFLTQPDLVIELVFELVYQFVVQYVLMFKPLIPYHIGQEAVDMYADKKQGSYA
ncbi:hypothetical protein EON63_04165 [archaeon]|nr:MAG: hypothetical protein EON63_04165 [archaeon]